MSSAAAVPDLRPAEDVVWFARQHWTVPARRAPLPVLVVLATVVTALASGPTRATWPAPWPMLAAGVLTTVVGLALAYLLWLYLDWIDDALIVTTQRIIWLRKTAFFHETRREILVDHVQSIRVVVDGLWPLWLGYGDLLVESAGGPALVVPALARPDDLRHCLVALRAARQAERAHQQRATTAAVVRAALGRPADATDPPPPDEPPAPSAAPLVWRRHWWFLARATLQPLLLLGLTGLGALLVPRLPGPRDELTLLLVAALLGLGLIGLGALVWAFLLWREDLYLLDGDRLVDIEGQPFLLHHHVKETTLDRVQDLAYTIPHPWAHLLGYGDVLVQTAGETHHFTFDGVAQPRAVHAAISARLAASREAAASARQRQVRDEILTMLHAYHHLQAADDADAPPDP